MPSDYKAIRTENQQRYGTDIARIGPMLLADRYDDRTHFIYELLQNAEDALARRRDWSGHRGVRFCLGASALRLSHRGKPFDGSDTRGICGIAESTKDRTAIGRFGIGFKSVYAYTSRPEVHSGDEDFAIENFVWPMAADPIGRGCDETIIHLPLNAGPTTAHAEIAQALRRLGPGTLLFLREIEEIEWEVEGGQSGIYLRSKPEILDSGVRRITVLGQETGGNEIEESWLIFSRDVCTDEGVGAGQVEIAFSTSGAPEEWSIQLVANSPLVVFFPTVVPTNLGFLVQGPYRTTPSRDNVPRNYSWNKTLVIETASLVGNALEWLRGHDRLDVSALRCLPLDRGKFPEGSMFLPVFETVRNRLKLIDLLPTSTGSYIAAPAARLARTQELRELFSPNQLGALLGAAGELAWLSGEISADRTQELRQYVMRELEIVEITPEMILSRLDKSFLQAQTDEWILKLYGFLQGQPALARGGRLESIPVVRLNDGTHVTARENGQPRAFLPSKIETAFPTMRESVCSSNEAREFLATLGLTEPDPVDDVVWNVLPKYRHEVVDVPDDVYPADIRRILAAFGTDSKAQREKLIAALRETTFVMAVDPGDGSKWVARPGDLYLATARLKDLFAGVKDVLLVNDEYDCLRGEDVRDLMDACGASRCLLPVAVQPEFTWEQRRELRIAGGCENSSSGEKFIDHSLRGLDRLLANLIKLDHHARARKASLLWEALGELQDRRGASVFTGLYQWSYYHTRSATFESSFLRRLNTTPWIPDAKGELYKPCDMTFEVLGWNPQPFLLSKIRFKPPVIEMLAKEIGLEPGMLELLKKLGLTSEADLRARLGIQEDPRSDGESAAALSACGDQSHTQGEGIGLDRLEANNEHDSSNDIPELFAGSTPSVASGVHDRNRGARGTNNADSELDPNTRNGGPSGGATRITATNGKGERAFISYISVHPSEDNADPDGLGQKARMELEEKAIKLILSRDPRLERTPTHNRGFDLFEPDAGGQPLRWVEVKAMTGQVTDRPVCLSRAQFDCAWIQGDAYWLYIVERAADSSFARILRIQDPAGKAKSFAFDQGWRHIADFSDGNPEAGAS